MFQEFYDFLTGFVINPMVGNFSSDTKEEKNISFFKIFMNV